MAPDFEAFPGEVGVRRHILPIVILFVFSWWSVRFLFEPGFFPMHDDTQVARVVVMGKALRNGQFPVRWVSDLGYGYGYPLFNFYGPLPYYVGGFLYMWGVPAIVATKIMFITGILLAGIAMYGFVAYAMGTPAGVVAAIAYMYAPYHAVQIFVRGAVGEFWAMAFFPLVAEGLLAMRDRGSRNRASLWGGIGLAGVVLSHTIFGYLAVLFVFAGIILWGIATSIRRGLPRQMLVGFGKMVGIGLGTTAFFWLPAIVEMGATSVSGQIGPTANFRDHFVCLSQLWNAPWGFAGSARGCLDGMSFKLGKLQVLLAAAGMVVWWIRRRTLSGNFHYLLLAFGITLGSIFLMLPASQFLWEIIPFSSYVQYPWRMLAVAVFGLSVLGAMTVLLTRRRTVQWAIAAAIVIGIVSVNAKWFVGQERIARPALTYEDTAELRFRVSRVSDEYLPPEIRRPTSPSEIVLESIPATGRYTVETEVDTETYARFAVHSNNDTTLTIRRAYFPGWKFFVNGKNTNPRVIDGLPNIAVSAGESVIEMHFFSTPVRVMGNAISVLALGAALFLYGNKQKKNLA